mmetsp:Transcript_65499/g.158453  ORF Transcript_65499/g.158453 Transcript_65499/m.158453 type:complete len:389 (+) Transcript_65499:546-1712(+)
MCCAQVRDLALALHFYLQHLFRVPCPERRKLPKLLCLEACGFVLASRPQGGELLRPLAAALLTSMKALVKATPLSLSWLQVLPSSRGLSQYSAVHVAERFNPLTALAVLGTLLLPSRKLLSLQALSVTRVLLRLHCKLLPPALRAASFLSACNLRMQVCNHALCLLQLLLVECHSLEHTLHLAGLLWRHCLPEGLLPNAQLISLGLGLCLIFSSPPTLSLGLCLFFCSLPPLSFNFCLPLLLLQFLLSCKDGLLLLLQALPLLLLPHLLLPLAFFLSLLCQTAFPLFLLCTPPFFFPQLLLLSLLARLLLPLSVPVHASQLAVLPSLVLPHDFTPPLSMILLASVVCVPFTLVLSLPSVFLPLHDSVTLWLLSLLIHLDHVGPFASFR